MQLAHFGFRSCGDWIIVSNVNLLGNCVFPFHNKKRKMLAHAQNAGVCFVKAGRQDFSGTSAIKSSAVMCDAHFIHKDYCLVICIYII